jgi:CRISPR type I-D-associated protein Csc1
MDVFSPIFFASLEGNAIHTEKILSSTALTYAIAESLRYNEKKYFLYGSEAITPNYSEILDWNLFVSEGMPIDVNFTPLEFRSTQFMAEENLSISTQNNPYPENLQISSKSSFFKQVRRYIGINIGSKYQIVIVSKEKLDSEIFINLGIKKSGELRLRKKKEFPTNLTLNLFLLTSIYNIPFNQLFMDGTSIERLGDYRLTYIHNIPFSYFKDQIIPIVIQKWK